MRRWERKLVPLGLALAFMASAGCALAAGDLAAGFRQPPASAKPHTWWHWINGNTSKEGITADLEAMKRVGVGGAQIFNVDCGLPDGPVPFMSDRWRELIGHAIREAHRLGIELCIHNGAGWSSSGGPWNKPENAMQMLVWTETHVQGPVHTTVTLPQPTVHEGFYRDVAVLAFPTPTSSYRISDIDAKIGMGRIDRMDPKIATVPADAAIERDRITNVSTKMAADGKLVWDVPEGDWTILRIGYTPTGAVNAPAPESGRGLECDKLSSEALDAHWAGMMATVLREAGPLAPKTLNNVLIDSYERGFQDWTPKFAAEFQRRRGYDPIPLLSIVTGRVVGDSATSERFLWDFRRTVCDLWAEKYYGHFAELCRKHGMMASSEPYGNGAFDNLQCSGLMDVPMGEFWVGGWTIETTKMASSAGHTNARKYVGAESFTADDHHARWQYDPYSIKALGDYIFCMGVNRYIFHRYAQQPFLNLAPGVTMGPWGTNFERTQTWWNQGAAWLRYVARCQYLLQSGLFAADACYFVGEGGPNDLLFGNALRPTLPTGYDYDGCDATVILHRMSVKNGRIVLPDGMSYRVLVLPETKFMTPAMARKIRDMVKAGATVYGPRPEQSPSLSGYPKCDDEVRAIADEVWGSCDGETVTEHRYGKGRIVWGKPIVEAIGAKPDFEWKSSVPGDSMAFIHRKASGADLYFVSNQRYRPVSVDCTFRVNGKVPELWWPDTGKMERAPIYRTVGGRTVVSLKLDPAGSVFVVFRKTVASGDHAATLKFVSKGTAPSKALRIVITSARYESTDATRGADVTEKVQSLVDAGQYTFVANNELFGDPVSMVVKQLRVKYTVNGKTNDQTIPENSTVDLVPGSPASAPMVYDVQTAADGRAVLIPWRAGTFQVQTASGRLVSKTVSNPETVAVSGSWSLRFPAHLGAPPSVKLAKLESWTENANTGVKYFSGTATYNKTFAVPAGMLKAGRSVCLDLGIVKNLAEVTVNGHNLGVLWKVPFRVDVTGLLKPGNNSLLVRVTNLWPNRLIGDEQYPDEVEWTSDNRLKAWPDWVWSGKPRPKTNRIGFATWRMYTKDSPLFESGLIGPVVIRSAAPVALP